MTVWTLETEKDTKHVSNYLITRLCSVIIVHFKYFKMILGK